MKVTLTRELARKVLAVVDAGIVSGLGTPRPGDMCVEAAVCYALGEDHGDHPSCVSPLVAGFKISLNDRTGWGDKFTRAEGLRKLAIAQLGSSELPDDGRFQRAVHSAAVELLVPYVANSGSKSNYYTKLIECVSGLTPITARTGMYYVYAAVNNLTDGQLTSLQQNLLLAEIGLQALIAIKSPGVEYLDLVS